MESQTNLFLGLDMSTQSLKGVLLDEQLHELEDQITIQFDSLPFGTKGGVIHEKDGLTVRSPPLMWVEALDVLFESLRVKGLAKKIKAISVSGQQHGRYSIFCVHLQCVLENRCTG